MAGLQPINPVYLPRRMGEDDRAEDYDTSVAQNENLLNQNFSALYLQVLELTEAVEELERMIRETTLA